MNANQSGKDALNRLIKQAAGVGRMAANVGGMLANAAGAVKKPVATAGKQLPAPPPPPPPPRVPAAGMGQGTFDGIPRNGAGQPIPTGPAPVPPASRPAAEIRKLDDAAHNATLRRAAANPVPLPDSPPGKPPVEMTPEQIQWHVPAARPADWQIPGLRKGSSAKSFGAKIAAAIGLRNQ